MEIQKILLATDLSEEAERPYRSVAELARANNCPITLLHIVEDPAIAPHGAPLAPPIHTPALPKIVEKAEETVAEHAARLGEGLQVEPVVLVGSEVAKEIAAYAKEHGHDLLAISSHGRSGFRRFLLGSVAETLLRHVSVPVLVFPRAE